MINILLTDAGKRFNRDWIFRHINYIFQQGKSYAITGPNGSGKSTLLQTIAGAITPSEGKVEYRILNNEQGILNEEGISNLELGIGGEDKTSKNQPVTGNRQLPTHHSLLTTHHSPLDPDQIYNHIAIVAPYLEVIEEMTATEFLQFHSSFKPLIPSISIKEILEIVGLKQAVNKQIRFFSSGMKQRIKLAQAIFSNVPVLLLDEPCTNLDTSGYNLYHQLINDYCKNKLIIVSSNDVNEYDFCEEKISITEYK